MPTPIKRHTSLQPLSRDHHQGLIFALRISKAVKKGIEPQRIKKYCRWFWANQLQEHFTIEEKVVFPVLGTSHSLIKRALEEHRRIEALISEENIASSSLLELSKLLENHIRFEERELFNEIQSQASKTELEKIEQAHEQEISCPNYKDEFWK